MAINPDTVIIQGDLSRNDARELIARATGKVVIEFGMGGSTLLLARCAAQLISYDTDIQWVQKTARRLQQITDKTCEPALVHSPAVPDEIPCCEVLFLDGLDIHRIEWLRRFANRCGRVIVHDSRVEVITKPVLAALAEDFRRLDTIECHVHNSNLLIATFRPTPALYENWNITEAHDRRAGIDTNDYVPD